MLFRSEMTSGRERTRQPEQSRFIHPRGMHTGDDNHGATTDMPRPVEARTDRPLVGGDDDQRCVDGLTADVSETPLPPLRIRGAQQQGEASQVPSTPEADPAQSEQDEDREPERAVASRVGSEHRGHDETLSNHSASGRG